MSDKIIASNLEDVLSDRISRYSKYIIQDRALPDVRDGLKPVQRRILYAMKKEGNTADKAYRKSAKTVGLVIGNYHPHGDSSVYEAMVRMAQDWKMQEILVDMQGNKGSIDDDPPAAMRYTEARLSKIAEQLIGDIDSDTVNFVLNFDDSDKEPTVFPAKFLNILVNGSSGIAYGYATKIPTHNLQEVTQACIYRLTHPNCGLEDIMNFIKGPDFPTGGTVFGKQGIIDAFSSGIGRIVLRGKAQIQEKRGTRVLVITEIPYEVIKSQLVEKIDKIRVNKEIEGIVDVRDESDRTGLKIVIELKKDAKDELILNYLYKNTSLQVYYSYNMVCIVDKKPMQLGLINIIDSYLAFYEEFTLRLVEYQKRRLLERLHILEGLMKAISILDEIIKLIRSSKDKADAKRGLVEKYDFSEIQAEAIVMLQLYRLTNTDLSALQKEYGEKQESLKEKDRILSDRDYRKELISKEMQEVAETFASGRKTQIEEAVEEITIDEKALITSETVMLSVSRGAYINHASLRSYKASDSYPGLREGDLLLGAGEVDSLDSLVVTAKSGSYACLSVYDLSESRWKDIGEHVNKYVNFAPGDSLVDVFIVTDFSDRQVLTVSAKGQIRRCNLADYQLQRRSKISSGMKLKSNDEVVRSLLVNEDDEVVLTTASGWCLRYPVTEISLTGLNTQGMRALNLGKDDRVVDMQVVSNKEMFCVFSNNGSKRVRLSEIERSNRNKKGVMVCKRNRSKPVSIVATFAGNLNDLLIIQNSDYRQLMVKDVSLMEREATFSQTIKLSGDWQLVRGLQYQKEKKTEEKDSGLV